MRFKEFGLFEAEADLNRAVGLPGFEKTQSTTPAAQPTGSNSAAVGLVKPATRTRGPEIAVAQAALELLGYNLSKFGVDGIKGPETTAAIRQYQKDLGVLVTGELDADTAAALNTAIASKPELASKVKQAADIKLQPASSAPALAQDAVTTGKIGELLNFIARYESKGNYNIIYGGKIVPELTKMTLNQLYEFQREMVRKNGVSSAVGRYQFIRKTLVADAVALGLDPNTTVFDEKTQDRLATYELQKLGVSKWLSGNMPDEVFLNKVARVWASIPTTGGKSYYANDGINKSLVGTNSALATFRDIRTNTALA